jgi:hypothetical protein
MRDPEWSERSIQLTRPGMERQLEPIPHALVGTPESVIN